MLKELWVQLGPDGHILNQGCYTAYYAARSLGISTRFYTTADEFLSYIGRPENANPYMCVGGISTLRKIFEISGFQQPEIHAPHIHLPGYVKRKMFETTLGAVRAFKTIIPIFIKPLTEDKTFTGYVVRSNVDLIKLRTLPDDFSLLGSEVVKIVSEYRVFINRYAIVGVKHYAGDYKKMIDIEEVEYAISDYKEQKAAYSLDFGITEQGETVLIEINDAFGIAPYGLEPVAYLKFLQERWEEITSKQYISQ